MTPIPPPRYRPRAVSQLPLIEAVPVSTRADKSLYCPQCVGYKPHHPVAGADTFKCRACGRERKDNK
jgi:hypothetical protein